MVKYDTYKDSGIEWIGDIPEHWEVKRLKYIGDSIIGITYNPKEVVQEKGTLVLRSSNIQNGKLSLKDTVYINKDIPKRLETRIGDILICSRNGSRKLIGKNITIDEKIEGETFGAFMTVFRTKQYQFISKYFNSQVFSGQSGLFLTSTINQLTVNTLNNFYTALPPEDEQIIIAKYLDDKTAQINDLISQKKKLLNLYEKEKRAVINRAVTKGIKSNVKLKFSGIESLGDIPIHWEVKRFTYVFDFSRGLGITKANLRTNGIPCVNYGEIHSKYGFEVNPDFNLLKCVDEKYLELSEKSLLTKGDFVFADTSEDIEGSGNFTYLNSEVPTFAGYHTIIARLKNKNENIARFFAYFFDSIGFRNQIRSEVRGTKVYSITQLILKNTKIVLPTYKEQESILLFIDTEVLKIKKKEQRTKELISLLKEYKTALISDVVTGKIKVY